MNNNIILIGFMGCGKTTVGRSLANKLGFDFVDTDQWIEQKRQMKISDIFSQYGEDYFRELETISLEEMIQTTERTVISAGGGLPLREENRSLLRRLGKIVFLNVSENTVLTRLQGDTTRPLLQGENKKEKVSELLNKRLPLYREAMNVEIVVDDKTVEEIISELGL